MKRNLHSKINMRPQLVKAIIAAAKIEAAIIANRMILFY
jgi:hypothetical protein